MIRKKECLLPVDFRTSYINPIDDHTLTIGFDKPVYYSIVFDYTMDKFLFSDLFKKFVRYNLCITEMILTVGMM